MNSSIHRLSSSFNWGLLAMVCLGFWMSASLMIDGVVIPSLWFSGMMAGAGFASAGYTLFGTFNHLELICSAIVLSSFLVFYQYHSLSPRQKKSAIIFASILFAIALTYTYLLTPMMGGLGFSLHTAIATNPMPPAMVYAHGAYWVLELCKLFAGFTLLRWCYRSSCSIM